MTRLLSRQLDREHLGRLLPEEGQAVLAADRPAVALSQHGPVHGDRSAGDVDTGMTRWAQSELSTLPRADEGDPEVHVLVDLEASVSPFLRSEEHERPAGPLPSEGLLPVGRLQAPRVRHDPDLQEVHGLDRRVVGFAVGDARARAHQLDLSGPDHAAPSRAVLVLERALEPVGQNLHVSVAVGAECCAGLHAIIVDHSQGAEPHVGGVVVVAEREGVPAVEPAPVGAAALLGGSNLDHRLTSPGHDWRWLLISAEACRMADRVAEIWLIAFNNPQSWIMPL